jgi:hypothetical protein
MGASSPYRGGKKERGERIREKIRLEWDEDNQEHNEEERKSHP